MFISGRDRNEQNIFFKEELRNETIDILYFYWFQLFLYNITKEKQLFRMQLPESSKWEKCISQQNK